MWNFDQPYLADKRIPPDDAWRRFDEWRVQHAEIGVLFVAKPATVATMGTVHSLRDGMLRLQGSTVAARFNLQGATFMYGPVQMFPRWPMGPMVEVMAVSACLPSGEWLMLAEGMLPETVAPRVLE